MPAFVGTFGYGQYCGLLSDKYVEIHAESKPAAHDVMVQAFGAKWSNVYDRDDANGQIVRRDHKRLGLLDAYGNILERGEPSGS